MDFEGGHKQGSLRQRNNLPWRGGGGSPSLVWETIGALGDITEGWLLRLFKHGETKKIEPAKEAKDGILSEEITDRLETHLVKKKHPCVAYMGSFKD